MHKTWVLGVCGLALAALTACQDEQPAASPLFDIVNTPVGDVDFPVKCNAKAAPLVERGVALLHHMMYQEADFVFAMAIDADPSCAMGYWGQGMTIIHPLWPDVPSATALARGVKLVTKASKIGGNDDRENGYISTIRAYFESGDTNSEAQRLVRFEQTWKTLMETFPDDLEARAFYALALRAIANPKDPELRLQREAGLIAKSVLAKKPNHPGGSHYLIHAYDFPELAQMALETADNYGKLTPLVPHATHMMTHIYTRLGLWEKAIKWNTISANTAWGLCLSSGEVNVHYTHALDYLAYAYLQTGDDAAVLDILNTADELKPPYSKTNQNATAYAFSALPARYTLERGDWEAAANLQPRMPASFPWKTAHDPYVAITHFARAVALSRLGRPDEAADDITALRDLSLSILPSSPYWAEQVEIQKVAAHAWQTYAKGDVAAGITQMRQAVKMETATQKNAVTPGEVLPIAEMFGDMLREAGQYEEALAAYQTALSRSPGRYNSLYGAGRAAMETGQNEAASTYFLQLLTNADSVKNPRAKNEEVRGFLNEMQ